MGDWVRFDQRRPSQGEYIAAITQRDQALPVEVWEADLERNAVGIWIDGEVWEGDVSRRGFTHWLGLPDRPRSQAPTNQLSLWGLELPNPQGKP